MREALLSILPMMIAMTVVNLVMPSIVPKLKKRELEDNAKAAQKMEVRMDKYLALFYKIGCIFVTCVAIVFMIPAVCEAIDLYYVGTLIVCLVGLTVIYLSSWLMLKRVDYTDEYFEYTNAIGIRKRFSYDDVTKVKITAGIIRIYVGKKSFFIFKAYAGSEIFVQFIAQKNPQAGIVK